MGENPSKSISVVTYKEGILSRKEDEVAVEKPLTVFINGEEFATLVCSPGNLRELVVGFIASEGVIMFVDDIRSLEIDEDAGYAYVMLNKPIPDRSLYSKRFIGSCCGKSRQFYFQNDAVTAKTAVTETSITAEQCLSLMIELQRESDLFERTGGVHNAALCSEEGVIISRSDIGRHNALDKLYGYSLLNGISVRDKIIAFSGRLSSEVLMKAAKIGVGIVLSKSAPTDLAITLASDLGITAVGFIRNSSFNIYSHPVRVIKHKGGVFMGKCNIDHSSASVREKLESQKSFLTKDMYSRCSELLQEHPDQHTLNELFHLLKKYDLADTEEKQERNEKIIALTN